MVTIQKSHFKTVIVGGGVAGLTLANALEKAGADYILLEAHDDIAPRVGASIGLLPNGSRILDQLGCYDKILDEIQSVHITRCLDDKGEVFHCSDGVKLLERRFSYSVSYLEREIVLRILYENIKNKSKIRTSKRVGEVYHSETGIAVRCEDGEMIEGDMLVGCDGIRSLVGKEMRRIAQRESPHSSLQTDEMAVRAEFQCLYGLSTSTPGVLPGEMDINFAKGFSTMVIGGKDGRVFWFIFAQMSQTYESPDIPRFTASDAEQFAEGYMDFRIKDKLMFRDLWHTKSSVHLAATEEAEMACWSHGRIALVGDNVHKMTPHMGAGGNAAMETAAALANEINQINKLATGGKVSHGTIRAHLQRYHDIRRDRSKAVCAASQALARMQALCTTKDKILAFGLLPIAGDLLVDVNCDMIIGASKLDYAPDPDRSFLGTMPFNPTQGLGQYESRLRRAIVALPLLFVPLAILWLSAAPRSPPSTDTDQGLFFRLSLDKFIQATPLALGHFRQYIQGHKWASFTLNLLHPRLWKASSNFDTISSLADFGIVYAVMLFESARRASVLTVASLSLVVLLCMQHYGVAITTAAYCYAHYIQTPLESFRSKDMRLTNRAYSGSVLFALLAVYYAPLYALSTSSFSGEIRTLTARLSQYFPICVSILQHLVKALLQLSFVDNDKIADPNCDLPIISWTVLSLSMVSVITSRIPWANGGGGRTLPACQMTATSPGCDIGTLLHTPSRFEEVCSFMTYLMWLLYLCSDMKKGGLIRTSWPAICGFAALVLITSGPGVAIGLLWLWRELCLAHQTHVGAITRRSRSPPLHQNVY